MEERLGWNAIIYDAPWAYFDKNQPGVTVSQDGKSCETLDDNRQYIKIIADENIYFSPRNGHAIFRQKGTDLYDVVCLKQDKTKYTYELWVDDVQMSECDISYDKLIQSLNVYLKKYDENGAEVGIIPLKESDYKMVEPKVNTKFQANNTYTIIVKGNYLDATFDSSEGKNGVLTVTSVQEITSYTETQFDHIEDLEVTKVSSSSKSCTLTPSSNNLSCSGGSCSFTASSSTIGEDVYYIKLSYVSCTNWFEKSKCGNKIKTLYVYSTFDSTLIGAEIISKDLNGVSFKLQEKPTTVKLILTETEYHDAEKGGVEEIEFIIT